MVLQVNAHLLQLLWNIWFTAWALVNKHYIVIMKCNTGESCLLYPGYIIMNMFEQCYLCNDSCRMLYISNSDTSIKMSMPPHWVQTLHCNLYSTLLNSASHVKPMLHAFIRSVLYFAILSPLRAPTVEIVQQLHHLNLASLAAAIMLTVQKDVICLLPKW